MTKDDLNKQLAEVRDLKTQLLTNGGGRIRSNEGAIAYTLLDKAEQTLRHAGAQCGKAT